MTKKFTKLIAALALLVFMMPSMAGWGQSRLIKTYKLTIDASYFNSTSYAANNNEKTSYAVNISDDTDTYEVKWTSYQVMLQSGAMQWQKNAGKIYNSTDLGTITSVTVTSTAGVFTTYYGTSSQPTIGQPGSGKGYFKTSVGGATGTSSKVEVVFEIEEGPATYSVTYKANEGTGNDLVDNNSGVGYGEGALVIVKANEGTGNPNFARTGYDFTKWNTKADGTGTDYTAGNSFNISSNTNLYAQWTKRNYNVAVNSIDGVTLTATYGDNTIVEGNNADVPYGTAVTLVATNLGEGQIFVWSITKTDGGDDVTSEVLEGTTLTVLDYAITIGGTVVQTYNVTYDCNGGTSGCPENVMGIFSGTSITLADAPIKTGSVFMGWNDGTTTLEAGAIYTVNNAVTFTAQWTVGGTGTIQFCGSAAAGKTLINSTSVSGNDNLDNTWFITTAPSTTKFAGNTSYAQVGTGSGSTCATSIEFTTTLSGTNQITSFSATFGCFASTSGTVTLKVGETVVGTHTISGTNDFTVTNNQNALGNVLTVLVEGTSMRMKCYEISYSYAEIGDVPIIHAPSIVNISSTDTDNEFAFEIVNPVSGKTLSATTSTSWISNVVVDNTNNKVTFTTTENETTTDRSGSITLSYDGADNKSVTINQGKIDYAIMPLAYNDGKDNLPAGFIQNGLGSDYSDANSKLKFDSDGDYLILKLREAPVSLTYSIKGNSFSAGNFDVQTSADGETYTDLANYVYGNVTSDVQTITHIDLGSNVRYIKWVFTDKMSGNIGIGNIHVSTNYDIYSDVTAENVTIPAAKTCTIYSGAILTVSGTLTNNGTAANLIIEDGGQLIHGNEGVQATVKKLVKSFNDTEEGGWKFIASPITETIDATDVANMIDATPANYDLYFFDEAEHMWRNYKEGDADHPSLYPGFSIEPQKGYLYAKTSDVELQFAGTMQPINVEMSVDLSYEGSGDLQGWNLVGNPFAFNAYTDRSYYVVSFDPNESNKTILAEYAASQNEPIPPCSGVLVHAESNDDAIVFANESYSVVEGNKGNVQMVVAQNVVNRGGVSVSVSDKAILSFNESDQLGKFYFGDNAKLYIPQNGKDYAIAVSEGQGTVPVNFKAAEDATYTITINPEGVEMNYLHLIDNKTGNDIDLLQTPSYSFDATTNDFESRFRLVFAAANNEDGALTGSASFAFMSDGNWIINNAGEATLQVIDLNGRILSSERVNGSVSKTINATPGVYMLRLINGENVMVQKIVVR